MLAGLHSLCYRVVRRLRVSRSVARRGFCLACAACQAGTATRLGGCPPGAPSCVSQCATAERGRTRCPKHRCTPGNATRHPEAAALSGVFVGLIMRTIIRLPDTRHLPRWTRQPKPSICNCHRKATASSNPVDFDRADERFRACCSTYCVRTALHVKRRTVLSTRYPTPHCHVPSSRYPNPPFLGGHQGARRGILWIHASLKMYLKGSFILRFLYPDASMPISHLLSLPTLRFYPP
jgi:hypothetical protein